MTDESQAPAATTGTNTLSLEQQLAALSAEERAKVEAAAAAEAAQASEPSAHPLYDARTDSILSDPRDLGPVGG